MKLITYSCLHVLQDLLIQVQLAARNEAHAESNGIDDSIGQILSRQEKHARTRDLLSRVNEFLEYLSKSQIITKNAGKAIIGSFEFTVNESVQSLEIMSPWFDDNPFWKRIKRQFFQGQLFARLCA